jgi:antitoxin (DNA-binding transcriptional repressor) of toxin-antitoxin stability system
MRQRQAQADPIQSSQIILLLVLFLDFKTPFNSGVGFGPDPCDNALMQRVTLSEAQKHLAELIRDLASDGELLITDADKPVAKLSPVTTRTSLRKLEPKSVGAVLHPFPSPDDDTLGEMLDEQR